jgi:hypothetical protein
MKTGISGQFLGQRTVQNGTRAPNWYQNWPTLGVSYKGRGRPKRCGRSKNVSETPSRFCEGLPPFQPVESVRLNLHLKALFETLLRVLACQLSLYSFLSAGLLGWSTDPCHCRDSDVVLKQLQPRIQVELPLICFLSWFV